MGEGFANDGYSRDDRAYHLYWLSTENTKLEFGIQASDKSSAVNPAFVIDGWGRGGAALRLNGKPVAEGKNFRIGHIDRLEGASLVVWVGTQLNRSLTLFAYTKARALSSRDVVTTLMAAAINLRPEEWLHNDPTNPWRGPRGHSCFLS